MWIPVFILIVLLFLFSFGLVSFLCGNLLYDLCNSLSRFFRLLLPHHRRHPLPLSF